MVSKKEPKTKTKVVTTEWPQVTKGSHLTVYTYEDGSTKLEWDDAVLLKEVQDAILKAESVIPVNSTRKPKKA
jgi:hypothetical protein